MSKIAAGLVAAAALAGQIVFGADRAASSATAPPISLHPDNPHYLLFRGRPTVLVGSTEHYGAVLNRDFDYVKYLNELKAGGLNLTPAMAAINMISTPGTKRISSGSRISSARPAAARLSSS